MQREILAQILPLISTTVFVMGMVVGSFLNVVVWRLPRGESLLHPGSHCPKCGCAIPPWLNIPVCSWLLLRGRCARCGAPISVRYPLVESATGCLYLALWWRVWTGGLPLSVSWGYFFLGGALLAAALIDLEHTIIPDAITFTGMAAAVVFALLWPASHLEQNLAGSAEGSHLILAWFLEHAGLENAPARLRALADVLLGIFFGYGMLRVLLEIGKRLWGTLRLSPEAPLEAVFTPRGLRLGEEPEEPWDILLFRERDRGVVRVEQARLEFAGDRPPETIERGEITVDKKGLRAGEQSWNWAEIRTVHARVTELRLPREVMGFGDLKLLAMIGAFLGADATIFILMIAAATGFVGGVVQVLLDRRRRHEPVPFGPFLAAATLIWILGGHAILGWYVRRIF